MLTITVVLIAAVFNIFVTTGASTPADVEARKNKNKEMHCVYPSTFVISNQTAVFGTPEIVSGAFVSGPGYIAAGYQYSKSYSYTASLGASLTVVPETFQVSLTTAFGWTDTWGTSITASTSCPANLTCGLLASALMLKVEGQQTIHLCGSTDSKDKTFPCRDPAPAWCPQTAFTAPVGKPFDFAAYYPITISHTMGGKQDLKAVHYDTCTVGTPSDAYQPCPGIDSVKPNQTETEKADMHRVDSLTKRKHARAILPGA